MKSFNLSLHVGNKTSRIVTVSVSDTSKNTPQKLSFEGQGDTTGVVDAAWGELSSLDTVLGQSAES